MNPGKLRHRITIQQLLDNESLIGTVTVSWADFATVWASVEPLNGREYVITNDVTPQALIRIRIRYLPGTNQGMRVKYGTRYFDIQSVVDVEERHREMELMCIEGDTRERRI